jgi:hypothetical protein
MIKTTLIHFIENLSWSKFRTDFNKYFFHGILFLLISLIYVLMAQFLAEALFYGHSSRLDILERLSLMTLANGKENTIALQTTSFLAYHVYFLYLLRNEKYRLHALGPKSVECYFIGAGILVGINLFLGDGFTYFVGDRYSYGTMSHNFIGSWINILVQVLIPMTGSYLGIMFLRRFMQVKPINNVIRHYFEIAFMFYMLSLIITSFSTLLVSFLIAPLTMALQSAFLVYAIAIFIGIVISNCSLMFYTYLVESNLNEVEPAAKAPTDSSDVIDQL